MTEVSYVENYHWSHWFLFLHFSIFPLFHLVFTSLIWSDSFHQHHAQLLRQHTDVFSQNLSEFRRRVNIAGNITQNGRCTVFASCVQSIFNFRWCDCGGISITLCSHKNYWTLIGALLLLLSDCQQCVKANFTDNKRRPSGFSSRYHPVHSLHHIIVLPLLYNGKVGLYADDTVSYRHL